MALTPKFTKADVAQMVKDRINRINEAILFNLQTVGEQFVRNARSTKTYGNITSNLRSSCGYVILQDGRQLQSNFEGTSKGQQKGKEVAGEVASQFPRGFVLIGVAGMEYAAAVEAKGYDVISSSAITAENALRKAIVRLSKKIEKL